ncbi:hypothetical protein [Streptomyces sp. MBT33]|uniref:hypothetical protein n=1 Tax=Streptomyces sp. MBT33 TaxID=1488363 RepID=UPI001909D0FC|nr:hypothetical protein [Streptomyces sp. MBT33]MBK3647432.1 hypothetical protein [Streptomyces sp. MBT33]
MPVDTAVDRVVRPVPGLLAEAVADAFGEGLRGLLDGVPAGVGALLGGRGEVVALLGAETDVHRLADQVGDDRLDRRDRGLLHRLDDRLDQRLLQLLEEPAHDQPGGLGRAQRADLGQTEGERRGGLRGGDLDGERDELGDDRPLRELDDVGAGLQHGRDDVRGLRGVREVTVASAVELRVRLGERVDRLTGVVRHDLAGAGVRRGVQFGDVVTELPPDVGALLELVLVRRRPVVAEHLENPFELARQHHRHSRKHPRQPIRPYNSLIGQGKSHRSTAVRKAYGITREQLQRVAVTNPLQVLCRSGADRAHSAYSGRQIRPS